MFLTLNRPRTTKNTDIPSPESRTDDQPKRWIDKPVIHFSIVMIVFAITGTSVTYISPVLSSLVGLERFSWQWWIFTIIVIFPIYQVLLLIVAFLFGKFKYFREKQLKMWRWVSGRRKVDGRQ